MTARLTIHVRWCLRSLQLSGTSHEAKLQQSFVIPAILPQQRWQHVAEYLCSVCFRDPKRSIVDDAHDEIALHIHHSKQRLEKKKESQCFTWVASSPLHA